MAGKFPLFTETPETPPEELSAGTTFAGRYHELWREADANLPGLADAKKRLAGL